jgi:hypothetical protein
MALPHPFGLRFRHAVFFAAVIAFLLCWITYRISLLIKAMTMAGVPNCPGCGLMHTSQSASKLAGDWLFRLFGCLPYKCSVCRTR